MTLASPLFGFNKPDARHFAPMALDCLEPDEGSLGLRHHHFHRRALADPESSRASAAGRVVSVLELSDVFDVRAYGLLRFCDG